MVEKTQCINPAEIQEGDLLSYLYGDAPPHVAAHIVRCAYCAEQVEQLRMVDSNLFTTFYRESCPTPEVLSDFVLKRLSAPEHLRVAAHIRQCEHCTAEVASVSDLEDTTPASLLKFLNQALALALILHPMQQNRVLDPVRGKSWQERFERDLLLVTVSTQPSGVTGRMRRRDHPPEADCSGEAWLFPPTTTTESEVYQSEIDSQGRFYFATVPPGEYTLLLRVGSQNLALQAVQVR